jgi:hypothetical protein
LSVKLQKLYKRRLKPIEENRKCGFSPANLDDKLILEVMIIEGKKLKRQSHF